MTYRQELEEIATAWVHRGWRERELDIVTDLHAENFTDHSAGTRAGDNEGFRNRMRALFTAFPDFSAGIEKLVIDETSSEVVVQWSASGTCQASYGGFSPNGQPVLFTGIDILRVEQGRITDRWGEWNWAEILHQLHGIP
ncbi:MAG TPA: ester cyclase [Chthoniobacterales bacterium]